MNQFAVFGFSLGHRYNCNGISIFSANEVRLTAYYASAKTAKCKLDRKKTSLKLNCCIPDRCTGLFLI